MPLAHVPGTSGRAISLEVVDFLLHFGKLSRNFAKFFQADNRTTMENMMSSHKIKTTAYEWTYRSGSACPWCMFSTLRVVSWRAWLSSVSCIEET